MHQLAPIKRFIYTFGFVASVATVAGVLIALLIHATPAEITESSPKVNGDIHSKVIHREIIKQLSTIEGTGTGYLAATLRRALPDMSNISIDSTNVSVDDFPYIGIITSTSGRRYHLEAELLNVADEVIPVYIGLTPVEEDEQ